MGQTRFIFFTRYPWLVPLVLGVLFFLIAVLLLARFGFAYLPLNDFTFTFYRAGNYLLQEQNVYYNAYPDPRDGKEYPPYNPIWIVYYAVPLAMLPLHVAEAWRFVFELVMLPLLALIAGRWAGLKNNWLVVLLAVAPWFLILVLAGQVSFIVLTAILLCYFGIRRANFWMVGIGIWFLALKPHIVILIGLAVLLYAWRNRILLKSLIVFFVLALLSSLAQPTWISDLAMLTIERLKNPRIFDSVLLLPGYPYVQLSVLMVTALFFSIYFFRSRQLVPSKWLWSVLVTISLLGGLHTVPYDWLNLMLPLAILMRRRWGVVLTVGLYIYPLIWSLFLFGLDWRLIPPTITPSIILGALLTQRYLLQSHG